MAEPIPTGKGDWASFQPVKADGLTLMHAHFTRHAFERHSHDTYSIGATRSGIQTFTCRSTRYASVPGDVILFNPDEPHDGRRGSDDGFGYSMLYVSPDLLDRWRGGADGLSRARYFRSSLAHDAGLAHALIQAAAALDQAQESLRAEELTSQLIVTLLERYGERSGQASALPDAGARRLERIRDVIEARYAEDLDVETLAREAGLSRTHLTRAFFRHFGMPPHVYLNGVRLRHARHALLDGLSLAAAAIEAGYADQSHFTRRFRGSFGITPGRWLEQMRAAGVTGRISPR
jgi:AraC-like DNA-binding protein